MPAGMVYLRARWYSPALGRFTQVDPVAGLPNAPATMHPYTYGLNSPLMCSDPSGKIVSEVLAVLVAVAYLGQWYYGGYSLEVLRQVNAYAEKNDMGFLEAYAYLGLHPATAMQWMDMQSCRRAGWDAAQAGAGLFLIGSAAFSFIMSGIDAVRLERARRALEDYAKATEASYRGEFAQANPELRRFMDQMLVHHARERQLLLRRPGLYTPEEITDPSNLRGIPYALEDAMRLHSRTLRIAWNTFYERFPKATRAQYDEYVQLLDDAHDLVNLAYQYFLGKNAPGMN